MQEPREVGFWSYILLELNCANDLHAVDVRSRVNTMIQKRRQVIADLQRASGVAIAADSDLDQAMDEWIDIVDRKQLEKGR